MSISLLGVKENNIVFGAFELGKLVASIFYKYEPDYSDSIVFSGIKKTKEASDEVIDDLYYQSLFCLRVLGVRRVIAQTCELDGNSDLDDFVKLKGFKDITNHDYSLRYFMNSVAVCPLLQKKQAIQKYAKNVFDLLKVDDTIRNKYMRTRSLERISNDNVLMGCDFSIERTSRALFLYHFFLVDLSSI